MRRRILRNLALAFFTAIGVADPATRAGAIDRPDARAFDHIYVIVLENHSFNDALYSGSSPFLLNLSRTQRLATNYFGVAHPSLPNYLAMIAGDEFGIRDDAPSCFASDLPSGHACHRLPGDTLVDQLEAAGLSFALYAETLPSAGALAHIFPPDASNALYAQKHNPFPYFEKIAENPARLARLKPLEALADDLGGAGPNFALIVPNQCHDGHGLPLCRDRDQLRQDYDAFVEHTVGLIRASPNWTQRSAIVVTFDEGAADAGARRVRPDVESHAGYNENHVATVVVTKCGGPAQNDVRLNHYSLLATIEDGFNLSRLRKAAEATTMTDMFVASCP